MKKKTKQGGVDGLPAREVWCNVLEGQKNVIFVDSTQFRNYGSTRDQEEKRKVRNTVEYSGIMGVQESRF
jgi:hypothetical protein